MRSYPWVGWELRVIESFSDYLFRTYDVPDSMLSPGNVM